MYIFFTFQNEEGDVANSGFDTPQEFVSGKLKGLIHLQNKH